MKEYLFQVTGGYTISGFGDTPGIASRDAQRSLMKIQKRKPAMFMDKVITGRYAKFDKDGLTPSGSFPYTVSVKQRYPYAKPEKKKTSDDKIEFHSAPNVGISLNRPRTATRRSGRSRRSM